MIMKGKECACMCPCVYGIESDMLQLLLVSKEKRKLLIIIYILIDLIKEKKNLKR